MVLLEISSSFGIDFFFGFIREKAIPFSFNQAC